MAAGKKETTEQLRELELKLQKLMRERSVYAAKARLLAQELEHYRGRELRQDSTVDQLLERQHEMAVMLNRSNMMLARAQDAAAALSLEFGELARALPAPDQVSSEEYKEQVEDKVQKINDLFKRTGQLSEEIADTLKDSKVVGEIGSMDTPKASAPPAPPPAAPEPAVEVRPASPPTPAPATEEPRPAAATQAPPEPVAAVYEEVAPAAQEPAARAAEPDLMECKPELVAEAEPIHLEAELVAEEQEELLAPDMEKTEDAGALAEVEAEDELVGSEYATAEPEPEAEEKRGVTVDLLFGRPRITHSESAEPGPQETVQDVSLVIEELANAQEQADSLKQPSAENRAGWRRFLRRG